MTRRIVSLAMVAATALLLAGCKTTEDPSKGGFMSGLANLTDGTYQRRQQERQTELVNQQSANQTRQQELAHVAAEADSTAAQLDETEKRYASMRRDLDLMMMKLGGAKGRNASLVQRIKTLENKVAMIDSDRFTPVEEKRKRLESLQKEKALLEQEAQLALGR